MPKMPTKPISEKEALLKLSALCSRAEHSSGEMRDKLRRWGVDNETSERIVARLVDERFVDDERFCRFFVRDKIRFDKWGRRKIEQALYVKGVDSEVGRKVLDEVDDSDYMAVLRPLIAAKRHTVKAASDYEMNAKLMRYAMSRGFDMRLIRQCIDCDEMEDGMEADMEDNF